MSPVGSNPTPSASWPVSHSVDHVLGQRSGCSEVTSGVRPVRHRMSVFQTLPSSLPRTQERLPVRKQWRDRCHVSVRANGSSMLTCHSECPAPSWLGFASQRTPNGRARAQWRSALTDQPRTDPPIGARIGQGRTRIDVRVMRSVSRLPSNGISGAVGWAGGRPLGIRQHRAVSPPTASSARRRTRGCAVVHLARTPRGSPSLARVFRRPAPRRRTGMDSCPQLLRGH